MVERSFLLFEFSLQALGAPSGIAASGSYRIGPALEENAVTCADGDIATAGTAGVGTLEGVPEGSLIFISLEDTNLSSCVQHLGC